MPELFTLAFMQKAFASGAVLGLILPFLGVFVTLRRMSFFGDGIAHASLTGVAIGVVAGLNPFWMALLIGVLFGIIIYILEKKTNISSDAIIGLIFTSGLALGVVLMSLKGGYQPELISFLFGNILSISVGDLLLITLFSGAIFIFLIALFNKLALMVFDRDEAWLNGVPVEVLEFIFYIVLAVAVVLGVKLLGIILVSALLIIPPTTAKLISNSFKRFLFYSIIAGELSIIAGLAISYYLDLPSGATIILTGTSIFFIVLFLKQLPRLIR